MLYDEIKVGQKLWWRTVQGKGGRKRGSNQRALDTQVVPVYIMRKDDTDRTVMASIGGAPALWYEGPRYSRWTVDKPVEQ